MTEVGREGFNWGGGGGGVGGGGGGTLKKQESQGLKKNPMTKKKRFRGYNGAGKDKKGWWK